MKEIELLTRSVHNGLGQYPPLSTYAPTERARMIRNESYTDARKLRARMLRSQTTLTQGDILCAYLNGAESDKREETTGLARTAYDMGRALAHIFR